MTEGEQPKPDQTLAADAPEALTFASGRYVVTRLLNEGGQKRVYLGRDAELHRNVAIAVIKAEGLDEAALERVRQEARTIAGLGAQPHVITIFDVGEEGGRPYTVCEYMPGGDLRQELRKADGPLPLDRALAITQDVCQGLALAHAHGVLHRDVKPENIWFSAEGSAKLGDFGLAIAFGQSRMTAPGTVLGTAAYMPPEQALGSQVDARGDLYSLGCVLYELVTGRPPFLGDDTISVVSQHINSTPEAPSAHREELPATLDALIVQLLAKAPEERPASAVAVLEALSAMGAGESGTTGVQTVLVTPAPTVRRNAKMPRRRTLVAGAALVVVAGAAIAAGLVFMLRDSGGGGEAAVVPGATLVAEGYVPVLEPRDCPAELNRDPDVRCQDLVVPEDRGKPSGRQVRILVVVAPSKARQAGVPLVNIGGVFAAPGASELREYGDVVGIGVRGTRFAEPVLTCPEVASAQREILELPINGPEANALFLDAAEQCGQRLGSEGVDLSAYGDGEIADDVRDLAIARGWRQINVEGSGTSSATGVPSFLRTSRTAMLLAARYPGLVRAVVLADPYPAGTAARDDIFSYNSAFEAYYAACRADPACERAFPDLEQAAAAVYTQYQQNPAVITALDPAGGADIRVLLDGDRSLFAALLALASPFGMPVFASSVFQGEGALPIIAAFLVLNVPLDPGEPWGAWFSQYCADEDQAVSNVGLQAAAFPLFGAFAHDPYLELCPRWPTKSRARTVPGSETAITVPALILTGALNPFSPPAYAQAAAEAFSDPTVAVFPSLTGGVLANGPPCISALRLAFLRDPTADLDDDRDGCIAQIPPIAFAGTDQAGSTPAGTPTPAP